MTLTKPRIGTMLASFKYLVKDFESQNAIIWLKIRVFRQWFKGKVKEAYNLVINLPKERLRHDLQFRFSRICRNLSLQFPFSCLF